MERTKGSGYIFIGILIQILASIFNFLTIMALSTIFVSNNGWSDSVSIKWFVFLFTLCGIIINIIGAMKISKFGSKGWGFWYVIFGCIFCLLSFLKFSILGIVASILYIIGGCMQIKNNKLIRRV